ncbi:hypothetical protein CHUAL_001599 [Chamberlinius hualienensis]
MLLSVIIAGYLNYRCDVEKDGEYITVCFLRLKTLLEISAYSQLLPSTFQLAVRELTYTCRTTAGFTLAAHRIIHTGSVVTEIFPLQNKDNLFSEIGNRSSTLGP